MSQCPVGILGGMGPEATILLQRRLLDAVTWAADDADHVPLIVDMNPQVPSRIKYLIEGHGRDPAPVLAQMAQRLEAAGASALAMPCNTAHAFKSAIENAVSIPFLDMVELASSAAARGAPKCEKIGILASPAVKYTSLFEKSLAALERETLWPKDEAALLDAIKQIKAEGATGESLHLLQRASLDLKERGASTQLVACSEFSMHSRALQAEGLNIVDTLDCLVEAILKITPNPKEN